MGEHRSAGAGQIPQVGDDDTVTPELPGGFPEAAFESRDVHEFGSGKGQQDGQRLPAEVGVGELPLRMEHPDGVGGERRILLGDDANPARGARACEPHEGDDGGAPPV